MFNHNPRHLFFLRSMHKFVILLIMGSAVLVGVSTTPTEAAHRPRGLQTSVSSDSFTPPESDVGKIKGRKEVYVQSSEGTGETVGQTTEAAAGEPEVAPVASPGKPETVIGADNRYKINTTTTYPYRAIAHVTSSIGGCTGWFINANTIITAGHCVYGTGWATNVRVYPGRNGSYTPYGSCGATRLFTVTGWTTRHDPQYDYGAIKLNCTIGNSTGWFGYRWQSSTLTGQATYIAGYPGDKTYATMWRHDDKVRITDARRIFYANDTYAGQSGSPVWNGGANCSPCGIAIHTYGVGSNGYNGGTRITSDVFNNLTNWRNS